MGAYHPVEKRVIAVGHLDPTNYDLGSGRQAPQKQGYIEVIVFSFPAYQRHCYPVHFHMLTTTASSRSTQSSKL